MSSLQRAALSVGLTLVPMLGTGCSSTLHIPRPLPLGGASAAVAAMPQPSTSENKLNLARLEESRGNFANAKKVYSELFQKEPSSVAPIHRLAVICLHMNQQEEADYYFKKAYALDSTNPELLADMGFAAFQKKDYAKAEEYLELSANLDGSNGRTIENLAIARAWRGRDEASLAAFRQVHDEAESIRRLNSIQQSRSTTVPVQPEASQQLAKARPTNINRIPDPVGAPPIKDYLAPPLPAVKTEPLLAEDSAAMARMISITAPASAVQQDATVEAKIELPPNLPEIARVETPVNSWVDSRTVAIPAAATPEPVSHTSQELVKTVETVRIPQESITNIPLELATKANPSQFAVIQVIQTDSQGRVTNSGGHHESTKVVVVVTPQANFQNGSDELGSESASFVQPNSTDVRFASNTNSNSNMLVASSKPASPWRKTAMSRRIASEDQPIRLDGPIIRQTSSDSLSQDNPRDDWRVCLVSLIEENKVVPGKPVYTAEFDSRNYHFASADAYRKFRTAPKNYVPTKEGMDVVALKKERNAIPGSLNFAVYHQHRLYLFATQENAEEFTRHPNLYVLTE